MYAIPTSAVIPAIDPFGEVFSVLGALGAIASHQPITPIIETVRALLTGTPAGGDAVAAVAWCAGAIVLGSGAAALLFRARSR